MYSTRDFPAFLHAVMQVSAVFFEVSSTADADARDSVFIPTHSNRFKEGGKISKAGRCAMTNINAPDSDMNSGWRTCQSTQDLAAFSSPAPLHRNLQDVQ